MPLIAIHELKTKLDIFPFTLNFWWGDIQISHITLAISENRLELRPFTTNPIKDYDHAARIAYLAKNPDHTPIWIEDMKSFWKMRDGCHRLAASVYNNKKYIACEFK